MSLRGKFISKFPSLCCFTRCIAIIFIFFITNDVYAQSENIPRRDTINKSADSLTINLSNRPGIDTAGKNDSTAVSDTSKTAELERKLGIRISKDALSSTVTAIARDSAVMNMKDNLFYLYGKAQVNYEDLQLNAGQVNFHQSDNLITASPYEGADDSATERVTFVQGKEKVTSDSMQYNIKSKRAIIRNARSQYGEGYMSSEQVKRNPDETIYGLHSVYTTCALDTPHFGIRALRIKAIPGRLVVSGACNLEIEHVPTPIWLPFGLFPTSSRQKSGFVLPTYTIEQQRGIGLLNGGYYAYLSDKADLLTQVNMFTKGSYSISGMSTYSNLYHYAGAASVSYAYNKTGESYEPGSSITKDFMVNWRHQSDGKAIPGQSFNASVVVGTSSFFSNNSYAADQILQNQYQSNISYAKNWQGKPFGLTISALHNQNTRTRQVNVTLPSINFHVTQVNPFQKKSAVGTHWYDKITASYNMDVMNKTMFYDSTFSFSNLSFNQFQAGVKHSIPVSAAYTILRYVNMSFNISYNEYWMTEELFREYNAVNRNIDTTVNRGFYTARDFNAGVNFSTRIYGMKLFKHGSLRGIRHVLTPNVGLSYHPDFGTSPFNYYYRTRLDSSDVITYQSPYVNSVIGSPPLGKAGLVNFGVNNNLQIKVRSKKDTVSGYKNVTLIDGLGINTSYNVAADSFQWSGLGLNFRTNIMDNINISSNASFDLYGYDYTTNTRPRQTMIERGDGIAKFQQASVSFGSNLHSKPRTGSENRTRSEEYNRVMRNAGYNDYIDMNIPWSVNINYSLNANSNRSFYSNKDTLVLTHSMTIQGELQVTERWKVSINSGYNFNLKQLTLTTIDVYRDLHCWAMHLNTIPFGPRKSFSFTLNVKAAILQDLKLMRRRDFRDTPY